MAKALPYFSKIVGSSAGADAGMFTSSSLALSTACSRTSLTSEADASAGAASSESEPLPELLQQELQPELDLLREPLVRQNGPLKKEERKPSYQNQQIALRRDP